MEDVIVGCAGGCGREVPLKQAVCRACVQEVMEWRRTYDGPALLSDLAERIIMQTFARVMADPGAV